MNVVNETSENRTLQMRSTFRKTDDGLIHFPCLRKQFKVVAWWSVSELIFFEFGQSQPYTATR